MHAHRVALCIAAVLGACAIVLPWVTLAGPGGKVALWGFENRGPQVGCLFMGMALLMSVTGKRELPLGIAGRLIVDLLSLLAFGAAALALYGLRSPSGGAERLIAALLWPGYGMFVLMVSAVVLFCIASFPIFKGRQSLPASASKTMAPPANKSPSAVPPVEETIVEEAIVEEATGEEST